MTEKTRIKNARMLSIFLGCTFPYSGPWDTDKDRYTDIDFVQFEGIKISDCNGGRMGCQLEGTQFSICWDWLMPVVEKIELRYATVEIYRCTCKINYTTFDEKKSMERVDFSEVEHAKTKILATYKAVIKFIKWYNKNVKNAI